MDENDVVLVEEVRVIPGDGGVMLYLQNAADTAGPTQQAAPAFVFLLEDTQALQLIADLTRALQNPPNDIPDPQDPM